MSYLYGKELVSPLQRIVDRGYAYLRASGIKVMELGVVRIQKVDDGRRFTYELVISFTGSVPEYALGETPIKLKELKEDS